VWPEFLPLLKEYGAFGLMAVMVAFGWLIPRWSHRERVADLKEQLSHRDATITALTLQRDKLQTELSKIALDALAALPKAKEPL